MNLRPRIRKVCGWWICSVGDSEQYVGINPVRAYASWDTFVGVWLRMSQIFVDSVEGESLFDKAPRT